MAVVVEPILTEEKLLSLLAEGHEQSCLDYKTTLDLRDRRATIELAKDVAAMQSEPLGGYIVVGADDHGQVSGELTAALAKLFDESTLRPKLESYLSQPFTVRTAIHGVDGNSVVVIYVGPAEHGWCIFKENGEYEDSNRRKKFTFRIGDVFVRHGTSSERWNDSDRERIVQQIVVRRKESWRAEFRAELASLADATLSARKLEELPSSAVTWQLDADGFDQLITELIRRNDDIPLRQLLLKAPADADPLIETNIDELRTLLDRLTSFGALALQFGKRDWLERVLNALVAIYDLGFDGNGYDRNRPAMPQIWLEIVARVLALGALAVRLEDWESLRLIATRRPHGDAFRRYGSWLRHAVTMAARASLLDTGQAAGLIARAHNVIRAVAACRPDRTANDDAILNSLCQFDALANLVVIDEQGSLSSGNVYPNFARYYTQRTELAFVRIIKDQPMRASLFTGTDTQLADAIAELSRTAGHESFRWDGWDGIEDGVVRQYLADNATS